MRRRKGRAQEGAKQKKAERRSHGRTLFFGTCNDKAGGIREHRAENGLPMAETRPDEAVAWVAMDGAQALGHGSLVTAHGGRDVVFLDDAGNAIGDSIAQATSHVGAYVHTSASRLFSLPRCSAPFTD